MLLREFKCVDLYIQNINFEMYSLSMSVNSMSKPPEFLSTTSFNKCITIAEPATIPSLDSDNFINT